MIPPPCRGMGAEATPLSQNWREAAVARGRAELLALLGGDSWLLGGGRRPEEEWAVDGAHVGAILGRRGSRAAELEREWR